MKNTILKGLTIVALLCGALTSQAQRSWDVFYVPRDIVLTTPQALVPGNITTTNGPIDVRMYDGVAKLSLLTATNTGVTGGTLTATVYGSPDQTNLTALANFALINSTTAIKYTNTYWGGTNLIATDNWLLPGTITTPTAASAGWTTKYMVPSPMTNSGAVTVTSPGVYEIGFNAGDAARYLYVVWTVGGTQTNFTVGAVVSSITHDTMNW